MISEPRVFKYKAERRGGHWWVSVFSAKDFSQTFAKLGELVMDDHDITHFAKTVMTGGAEFEATRYD
jgi:hypothetical protein